MNQKFDFNNHMVYNRIVQIINTKLDVQLDYERRVNPDYLLPDGNGNNDMVVPVGFNGEQLPPPTDFGFKELSIANVNKLPILPGTKNGHSGGKGKGQNASLGGRNSKMAE